MTKVKKSKLPKIGANNYQKLKVESWAGAATKISGYIGAIHTMVGKPEYVPNIIVGVSSGSIAGLLRVSLMVKPSLIHKLVELGKSFTLDDIFNPKPVNEKSKLTIKGILRGVRGKKSLGVHDRLVETLKEFFTEEVYQEYVRFNYPDLIICSTNIDTGEYNLINTKNIPYEEIFKEIKASTALPAIMEPEDFNLYGHQMDGGIRYGNAGFYVLYHLLKNDYRVSRLVSIYSRPKSMRSIIKEPLELKGKPMFKDILSIVGRSIAIMMFQSSKFCENEEKNICKDNGVELNQYFMPDILDNPLSVDKDKLFELYEAGREIVEDV